MYQTSAKKGIAMANVKDYAEVSHVTLWPEVRLPAAYICFPIKLPLYLYAKILSRETPKHMIANKILNL
jgi:hypothetical protein